MSEMLQCREVDFLVDGKPVVGWWLLTEFGGDQKYWKAFIIWKREDNKRVLQTDSIDRNNWDDIELVSWEKGYRPGRYDEHLAEV